MTGGGPDHGAGRGAAGGPCAAGRADPRITVVLITRNRRTELLRTLAHMTSLPERPPVIVVDNGSADGSAEAAQGHAQVRVIKAGANLGAVGRNVGVRQVATPYVAFCDDDTWWEPGALAQAADLLDAHPRLASVTGRILVEPGGTEDPITPELRDSPLPAPPWLPGPALMSILAGASILRVAAFRQVGGFSPRLWLGGEEELLGIDLAAAGWWMTWADGVIVHHAASVVRAARQRRMLGIRNTLWTAWLRRPAGGALRRTIAVLRSVPRDGASVAAVARAAAGLPWVIRDRQVIPGHVEGWLRLLEAPQRASPARRYVDGLGLWPAERVHGPQHTGQLDSVQAANPLTGAPPPGLTPRASEAYARPQHAGRASSPLTHRRAATRV